MHLDELLQSKILQIKKNEDDYKEIAALLNNPQIDPNQQMLDGQSYLCYAISIHDEYLINLLITNNRIDLNKKTDLGYFPLYLADINRNDVLSDKLLKLGADPTMTYNGQTAKIYLEKQLLDKAVSSVAVSIFTLLAEILIENKFIRTGFFLLGMIIITHKCISMILKITSLQHTRNSQWWIISKMHALKETQNIIFGNSSGVCSGVSHMATMMIQASQFSRNINNDSLDKLTKMLTRMKNMSIEIFPHRIKILEQKRLNIFHQIKNRVNAMSTNKIDILYEQIGLLTTDPMSFNKKKRLLIENQLDMAIQDQFSENERLDIEMPNFLYGVEILQNLDMHPELGLGSTLHRQTSNPNSLVTPQVLLDKGGLYQVDTMLGVFSEKNETGKNEMILYFQKITSIFKSLTFIISLKLIANNHVMSAHYDPRKNNWILIDANVSMKTDTQAITYLPNYKEIAITVFEKFKVLADRGAHKLHQEYHLIAGITIYVTGHARGLTLKKKMDKLKKDIIFKRIFEKTTIKVAVNNNGLKYVNYATYNGLVASIDDLYRKNYLTTSEYKIHRAQAQLNAVFEKEYSKCYKLDTPERVNIDKIRVYSSIASITKFLEELLEELKHIIVFNKREKQLEAEFWLNVLQMYSINNDLLILPLNCYAEWQYKGNDLSFMFTRHNSNTRTKFLYSLIGWVVGEIYQLESSQLSEVVTNMLNHLKQIYMIDLDLSKKMLYVTQELSITANNEIQHRDIKQAYLNDVFKKAGFLAIKSSIAALNIELGHHIKSKSIVKQAFTMVYSDYSSQNQEILHEFKREFLAFRGDYPKPITNSKSIL